MITPSYHGTVTCGRTRDRKWLLSGLPGAWGMTVSSDFRINLSFVECKFLYDLIYNQSLTNGRFMDDDPTLVCIVTQYKSVLKLEVTYCIICIRYQIRFYKMVKFYHIGSTHTHMQAKTSNKSQHNFCDLYHWNLNIIILMFWSFSIWFSLGFHFTGEERDGNSIIMRLNYLSDGSLIWNSLQSDVMTQVFKLLARWCLLLECVQLTYYTYLLTLVTSNNFRGIWAHFKIKTLFPVTGILIIKMRWSWAFHNFSQ